MRCGPAALLLVLCWPLPALAACRSDVPASAAAAGFRQLADGIVLQQATNRQWLRCALGQQWDPLAGSCTGRAYDYSYDNARLAARQARYAGYSDWRLPSYQELASLLEPRCMRPALNPAVFPAAPAALFWTATPNGNQPDNGLVLDVADGFLVDFRVPHAKVRLIR